MHERHVNLKPLNFAVFLNSKSCDRSKVSLITKIKTFNCLAYAIFHCKRLWAETTL